MYKSLCKFIYFYYIKLEINNKKWELNTFIKIYIATTQEFDKQL